MLSEEGRDRTSSAYKEAEHWPPYTYRDYPSVTPRTLQSFMDFLGLENTSSEKKELQPWIPFCDSLCTFCYFPVETYHNEKIETYLASLKRALKMYAETRYARSSEFEEVYFGGGSPNILSSEQIIELLTYCEKNFNISKNRMIKISGCTQNFDEKKLKSISDHGVNQADIGIQTLDNSIRRMLNLRDDATKAESVIKNARRLGLYVSIDLIYNLPGQTMQVWENDIKKALELEVESVDCYPLDVYPDTPLAKQIRSGKVPPMGNSDTEIKMYLKAYKMFTEAGYMPTCHNRFSRINEDFDDPCFEILGTGSGFFMGYLGKYSYMDIEPVEEYINLVGRGSFPISKLFVSSKEDEMKKMMMRLYIRLPVDRYEFQKRFGKLPEDVFPTVINKLKKRGVIEVNDRDLKLTKLGDIWRFNIAQDFGLQVKPNMMKKKASRSQTKKNIL
ncbi:MAG: coproporphyrinogen III oxidase family protein [archaeon]|nr:coproporphyrinogen III oxidase family protein [archaeon]